jgi:hypothetical protein
MLKLQGLSRLAVSAVLLLLIMLQSGCVTYSDGLLVGDIQYSNKTEPRLNHSKINNYPVNCSPRRIRFYKWQMFASKNPYSTKPRVLLLTNVSRKSILVDRYRKNASASAGWLSQLDPQNWSAMQTTQQNVRLVCTQQNGSRYSRVNCADYLNACWMMVKSGTKATMGDYWITENRGLQATYFNMRQRGIHVLPPGDL